MKVGKLKKLVFSKVPQQRNKEDRKTARERESREESLVEILWKCLESTGGGGW